MPANGRLLVVTRQGLLPDPDAVRSFAAHVVACGRVVPSLVVDDRGARARWVPLPAASDRDLLAAIVPDPSPEAHAATAAAIEDEVDALVRQRLRASHVALVEPRRGRPTVHEAWLRALTADDPRLPGSLNRAAVAVFAEQLDAWVRSGTVMPGAPRLCLRVHEPNARDLATRGDAADVRWPVELLLQDPQEPSLLVGIDQLWAGAAPFADDVLEPVLASLGRLVRVAPELAGVLDAPRPVGVALDTPAFLTLARERVAPLADAGIAVLLPARWTRRRRLGLRARASSRKGGVAASTRAALGLGEVVSFTWEAALGDTKLTARELRELERAAATKQQLVQVRGEWVEVQPGEIEAILRHAGTRHEATAADLLRTALSLDGVDVPGDVDVVGVVATGWLEKLLDDALHTTVTPIADPPGFAGTLRPYQQRGVGWLAFLGRLGLGACLADDMGLGKTAQLIATILADPAPGPTLVVCPVSVLGNWQRELERFAPGLSVMVHHGADRHRAHDEPFAVRAARHDVVLTTYSLVARDIEQLREVSWGRLALDEAQQVKNAGTAQARAVRQIEASRRIALTGTPVENRLGELWSLMHVLNPGLLGSAKTFKERFATPIEQNNDEEAAELLRRVTAPFVLRRLKTDRSIIDDLPDKIEQTERCPLTREQATLYQAVVDDLLEKAESTDGMDRRGIVLSGIARLKQVCNHPAHFLRDGSPLAHRSGKLTRVEELLDEILDAGDKVLCFTQFAEWGELLVPHFARRYGFEPLWLHGGVRRPVRDAMVAAFQSPDGPPLFLLSLKAGGTGLNLTAASHVIHLDRWWNPAVEDQATDRAYRIGQRKSVLVHKLVTTGTIEERIDAMITAKRELAQRIVGSGESWITELSTDELREVVALRVGADDIEVAV